MSASWRAPGAKRLPLPPCEVPSSGPPSVPDSGLRLEAESMRSPDLLLRKFPRSQRSNPAWATCTSGSASALSVIRIAHIPNRHAFLHIENWLLRADPWDLRLAGLPRAVDERARDRATPHDVPSSPAGGFRRFHPAAALGSASRHESDFVGALVESVRSLHYDLCVLTGDYDRALAHPDHTMRHWLA